MKIEEMTDEKQWIYFARDIYPNKHGTFLPM